MTIRSLFGIGIDGQRIDVKGPRDAEKSCKLLLPIGFLVFPTITY
jgi:hypothetical protein